MISLLLTTAAHAVTCPQVLQWEKEASSKEVVTRLQTAGEKGNYFTLEELECLREGGANRKVVEEASHWVVAPNDENTVVVASGSSGPVRTYWISTKDGGLSLLTQEVEGGLEATINYLRESGRSCSETIQLQSRENHWVEKRRLYGDCPSTDQPTRVIRMEPAGLWLGDLLLKEIKSHASPSR